MKTFREKLYLSTIDENAPRIAEEYGFGIELCQFCDTTRMDEKFPETDTEIRGHLAMSSRFVLHAPFSELYPATIDPKVLEVVKQRFRQAAELCLGYGIRRMVVHSGYVPLVYFKEWFIDKSIPFWKEFLSELPNDFQLLYENVMDDEPNTLKKITDAVNDPRFQLCLDVGHLNVISKVPAKEWIHVYGTSLKHVHIHNNHKDWDTHNQIFDGTLNIPEIIEQVLDNSPEATFTMELMDAMPSVRWLTEQRMI